MNPIEGIRKLTVREVINEYLDEHLRIYENAKNGLGSNGCSAETVLSWYKERGSRHHLLKFASHKLEELTDSDVANVFVWHPNLYNCSNFCKTCGAILGLDTPFWFIPSSYCDEGKCGVQICQTCLTIIGRTE